MDGRIRAAFRAAPRERFLPLDKLSTLGERGRTDLDRFRRDKFAALHRGRHARVVGRPRRPADLGRRLRLGLDDRTAGRVGGPDRAGRGGRADLATGGTGTRSAGRLAVGRRSAGRAGRPGCSRSCGIRPNPGLGDGQRTARRTGHPTRRFWGPGHTGGRRDVAGGAPPRWRGRDHLTWLVQLCAADQDSPSQAAGGRLRVRRAARWPAACDATAASWSPRTARPAIGSPWRSGTPPAPDRPHPPKPAPH